MIAVLLTSKLSSCRKIAPLLPIDGNDDDSGGSVGDGDQDDDPDGGDDDD